MGVNKSYNWINNQLRIALATTLKKEIEDITKDFLLTLIEINLSDCSISNLDGLEYATNLISVNLSKNQIIDASKISKLINLTNLELSENRIEDVSFLNKLKKLNSIGLDSNNISHIDKLDNLKKLKLINVSNNRIQDLSFIDTLESKNIKVIATEQCINLNPISIPYGGDYLFESPIYWNKDTNVLLDNIQVSGKYNKVKTNSRPSLLYSISKVLIKNIYTDCLLKADFYHEIPFEKSGILSGILIQPIKIKFTNLYSDIFQNNQIHTFGIIKGKLIINNLSEDEFINEQTVKNKLITLINSEGNKITCLTNEKGEYQFFGLTKGRYTILFPFLDKYEYITKSLYVCNLKQGEVLEVNSEVIKH